MSRKIQRRVCFIEQVSKASRLPKLLEYPKRRFRPLSMPWLLENPHLRRCLCSFFLLSRQLWMIAQYSWPHPTRRKQLEEFPPNSRKTWRIAILVYKQYSIFSQQRAAQRRLIPVCRWDKIGASQFPLKWRFESWRLDFVEIRRIDQEVGGRFEHREFKYYWTWLGSNHSYLCNVWIIPRPIFFS